MAQKYIVGDLVKIKLSNIEFIAEITDKFKHSYGFDGIGNDFNSVIREEGIYGVPLTSAILTKNGWKKFKRPYRSDYCYRRKGYPTLNIRSKKEVYFHWGDHDKSIITVHQLQHLLFGLGLNSEMEV